MRLLLITTPCYDGDDDTNEAISLSLFCLQPPSRHSLSLSLSETLIGCVEICVEEPTGLLTDPISINPFASKYDLTRREQPYLCNLCVHPSQRRQGLGIVLCQLCEELVTLHWPSEYANMIYLHVEEKNSAARALYTKMGYSVSKKTDLLGAKEKKMNGLDGILFYERELVDVEVMSSVE